MSIRFRILKLLKLRCRAIGQHVPALSTISSVDYLCREEETYVEPAGLLWIEKKGREVSTLELLARRPRRSAIL